MSNFEIKTVGIVGAGLMGTGIAEVCALAGYDVVLVKATPGAQTAGLDRIKASLDGRVAKGKLDAAAAAAALPRIVATAEKADLAGCDLVIESIVEDLAAKRTLFAELAQLLRPDAVLASITSTLRVTDLAEGIRPGRTIGLHFFSPVPMMSLVELAHLTSTDADVVPGAQAFVDKLGKTAVPVLD